MCETKGKVGKQVVGQGRCDHCGGTGDLYADGGCEHCYRPARGPVVVMPEGVSEITYRDVTGDLVGRIKRGDDGKPILLGQVLTEGPRIVETVFKGNWAKEVYRAEAAGE